MPRIPRDIPGQDLVKKLKKYGYQISRERGRHIRLVSIHKSKEHKITIPDHQEIKIGTLNNILNDVANYLEITKEELLKELFGS